MKHLFRQPDPSRSDYLALAVFALIYILIMAIVIAPDRVVALVESPFAEEAR